MTYVGLAELLEAVAVHPRVRTLDLSSMVTVAAGNLEQIERITRARAALASLFAAVRLHLRVAAH